MKEDNYLYTKDELKKLHDAYSLWWQYLYHSFWYKKFCKEMHKAKIKSAEIPDNLFGRTVELLNSIHESNTKNGLKFNNPPPSLILKSYWEYFGNIHNDNFEKWWENKKDSLVKRVVIDLRNPDDVELLSPFRKQKYPEKDNDLSFEDALQMVTRDSEYIFVAIPVRDITVADIGKQIAQIRKKHQKKNSKHKWLRGIDIMLECKLEIDELKRYLEYFKLKNANNVLTDEIIRKREIEEEEKANEKNIECSKTLDEIRKIINADIKRAEKIIKNVEKGSFPGSYQPKDKEK